MTLSVAAVAQDAAPARGGDRAIAIEQVGSDQAHVGSAAVRQIARPDDTGSTWADRTEPARQLSRADDRVTTAPFSGSVRADAQTSGSTAIGGVDRCDPATLAGAASAICADPIERRADQYRAPTPGRLSPEQRLAIARQTGDVPTINREAERLGRLPNDKSLTTTEQGIAALTLKEAPAAPAEPEKPKDISPAEVEALVQVIGTNGGQP